MYQLNRNFFARDTVLVAQQLLGVKLVHQTEHGLLSGLIVETEAYIADDPACHAFNGITKRNQALFGPVGNAYIYRSYGLHYCFNIVAHSNEQRAGGVLIRALKPLDGIEVMKQQRGTDKLFLLTSGPGNLTQAMHINMDQYGIDLLRKSALYVESGIKIEPNNIVATKRIGISKATDKLWRFLAPRLREDLIKKGVHKKDALINVFSV